MALARPFDPDEALAYDEDAKRASWEARAMAEQMDQSMTERKDSLPGLATYE